MEFGDKIEFPKPKVFSYIRKLGGGGTGQTVLVKDELLDELFAIKKYQPSEENEEWMEEYYYRFVDEIKMLFKIAHPNIVRPYNYYLYPEYLLGYIQMEFIDGVSIDEYIYENPKQIDSLFISALNAFKLLESMNILHRDIRPANLMVDNKNNLKIIDFGFGKIKTDSNNQNSVVLNWPVSNPPKEVLEKREYNHQTEIYYLGKLFQNLINLVDYKEFKYNSILDKMCEQSPENRYVSFAEVDSVLSRKILTITEFDENEKIVYDTFLLSIEECISVYTSIYSPQKNIPQILMDLEVTLQNNSLENYIQNVSALINIFIKNSFKYYNAMILVEDVKLFYELLANSSTQKQEIIINNLVNRLSTIKEDTISDEDLPF